MTKFLISGKQAWFDMQISITAISYIKRIKVTLVDAENSADKSIPIQDQNLQ